MYCLETLKAINARPVKLNTEHNREGSIIRSRGGYVIHSAAYRSTAFIGADCCTFQDAQEWHARQGPACWAWVDQIVGGATQEQANAAALAVHFGFPVRAETHRGALISYRAEIPQGGLVEMECAPTLQAALISWHLLAKRAKRERGEA